MIVDGDAVAGGLVVEAIAVGFDELEDGHDLVWVWLLTNAVG